MIDETEEYPVRIFEGQIAGEYTLTRENIEALVASVADHGVGVYVAHDWSAIPVAIAHLKLVDGMVSATLSLREARVETLLSLVKLGHASLEPSFSRVFSTGEMILHEISFVADLHPCEES